MADYRILVADDNTDVMMVIDAVLMREGRFELIHATNGEDALHLARTTHPHVMILDIMMPRVHGLKVCKVLKDDPATQDIRIIMLSALGREYTKREAFGNGANGYLTKPFSPHDLIESIDDVLRYGTLAAAEEEQAQSNQSVVFNRGDEVRVCTIPDEPAVAGVIKSRVPPGQWRENEWGYRVGLDTGGDVLVRWDQVHAV